MPDNKHFSFETGKQSFGKRQERCESCCKCKTCVFVLSKSNIVFLGL